MASLLFVHIASRYDTNDGVEIAHGESYVQKTPGSDEPESVEPHFILTVVDVFQNQQPRVCENLLCFKLTDPMRTYILPVIALVPLEPGYAAKINH